MDHLCFGNFFEDITEALGELAFWLKLRNLMRMRSQCCRLSTSLQSSVLLTWSELSRLRNTEILPVFIVPHGDLYLAYRGHPMSTKSRGFESWLWPRVPAHWNGAEIVEPIMATSQLLEEHKNCILVVNCWHGLNLGHKTRINTTHNLTSQHLFNEKKN